MGPGEGSRGRSAIVLAAGASTRMGTPKALLPWLGSTLIGHAVRELLAADVEDVVVVLGAHAERVAAVLPERGEVRTVLNADHEHGRSSSIRAGAGALPPAARAVLVQSVDQPCTAQIVARLFRELETSEAEVVLPAIGGRRGHPICLSGRLIPELCGVREEDQGLRAVVRRHTAGVREIAVDSAIVLLNLNDPAAYAAAYAAAGQS